ncbi:survival protein sure-like phosphatase/nucleotidase [Immersiella caudata]|uniref:Survival protein sure-like phosphatase/nucleotidase n=1 Tax=Immersiella caudata TaxID=314043 RepID=A0AA39WKL6_9PEZI|nr:survival protein sure-like phosphatase/nucleotidase [Immersiella caudata]
MHILIVNDDGPPSPHSSPYVHSLVRELQAAGHVVSVCLPHTQRSWIGKAHMIGQTVKPLYYRPPPPHRPAAGLTPPNRDDEDDATHGTTHTRPSTRPGVEEWILVDGTPASCVQIGLYHFFQDRGEVDLVVSGPNYGRNTTAVFALSSGTLGGALEAAVCRKRAIALSYAFFSRNHDSEIIAAAGRRGVKVIEALWKAWPEDGSVDLYSVNVPLLEGLEKEKVLITPMLQNYWGAGSCFTEVDGSVDGGNEDEERIREGEGRVEEREGFGGEESKGPRPHTHKHFKWSPRFTDVYQSVEEAPPGNDGWAVKEGFTSVTPLKANFFQTATNLHGAELQLDGSQTTTHGLTTQESATQLLIPRATTPGLTPPGPNDQVTLLIRPKPHSTPSSTPHFYALISYEDPYVQPLILSAFTSLFPSSSYTLLTPPTPSDSSKTDTTVSLSAFNIPPTSKILQISPYESIDFDYASTHPTATLINSYIIRKALIRKHFLSATVDNWVAKHPGSILGTHVKRSEAFEVDFAEFLDDALVEAWDLRESLEKNDGFLAGEGGEVQWWILKPSMSDRGQGIRLFATMEELQGIFDKWEPEEESEEEDEEEEEGEDGGAEGKQGEDEGEDRIMASHLRHFVAQPYIHPPLLLPEMDNRKFHVRVYVLAVGSLKVYVHKDMLALFAAKPYTAPRAAGAGSNDGEEIDLDAHLTNTCLQGEDTASKADSVHRFWDLPLPKEKAEDVFTQICGVTGELFEAAARGMMVHFQPLECAFEVYGLDFLVDAAGRAWLLEVNAFPDFKQTGDLQGVVAGFWAGVLRLAVVSFVRGSEHGSGDEDHVTLGSDQAVMVKDVNLGRRWGL